MYDLIVCLDVATRRRNGGRIKKTSVKKNLLGLLPQLVHRFNSFPSSNCSISASFSLSTVNSFIISQFDLKYLSTREQTDRRQKIRAERCSGKEADWSTNNQKLLSLTRQGVKSSWFNPQISSESKIIIKSFNFLLPQVFCSLSLFHYFKCHSICSSCPPLSSLMPFNIEEEKN